MRYVIDTNVLLDFFIERDKKRHEECDILMEKVKTGQAKVAILSVVVAEVVWVMSSFYKIKNVDITKTIGSLIQARGVRVIEKFDWSSVFDDFGRTRVKFVDAMIANIAQVREKKWVVVSFDKDFDKLGVKRLEPGEV